MGNTKRCYSKLAPVLNAQRVKGTGKLACQITNLVLNPDGTGPPGLLYDEVQEWLLGSLHDE